jgi:AraC-like DNA-binding protein
MMKTYIKEEHDVCYCYDNEENPFVKLMVIKRGEMNRITLPTNEIVFIMEGKIDISCGNYSDREYGKGTLLFLPAGEQLSYQANATSIVLILRLTDNIYLCHNYSIKQLYYRMKEEVKPESLSPLEINARLWHFAEGLIATWKDGLRCKLYLRSEISKLLTMLPVYYSKDELSLFFYPILSPDTTFSEFVRTNWLKYHSIHEFSSALNITTQQFTRRFHSVFGRAPYEWMQQQKARLIYWEIYRTNKPLKEIAADFGFTDPSNFNRFCKSFYETTPGRIRKKRP